MQDRKQGERIDVSQVKDARTKELLTSRKKRKTAALSRVFLLWNPSLVLAELARSICLKRTSSSQAFFQPSLCLLIRLPAHLLVSQFGSPRTQWWDLPDRLVYRIVYEAQR